MNQRDTNNLMLSPKRIAEKAAILETNLTKNVAKQTNPSELKIVIDRDKFPDAVILKALLQLTPRHNIQPRTYLLALRDFLKKDQGAPRKRARLFHTKNYANRETPNDH